MNKSFEQLEARIDKEFDESCRRIYNHIIEMWSEAFHKESQIYKYKYSGTYERILDYFASTEEYEKCSKMQTLIWRLKGVV